MEVNVYGRQLSAADIAAREHRAFVGGMWEEVGALQFDFLKRAGLKPADRLLDVGCGALRGGVHFVRYLDVGNYYGIDINASLIDAGRKELLDAGIADKQAHLLVDDHFAVGHFGATFDAAIAVSVFTHLPMNHIVRCLSEVGRVLSKNGQFFASFFEAPRSAFLDPLTHSPGGIVTRYDSDPFHYSLAEMEWMAQAAGLRVTRPGGWQHPRDQQMLSFSSMR